MKSNSGFSLTELAIVLAIFALITSAIVIAAAHARANAKLNRGINELAEIVNNVGANAARFALPLDKNPNFVNKCISFTDDPATRADNATNGVFPDGMAVGKMVRDGGVNRYVPPVYLLTPWSIGVNQNDVGVALCSENPRLYEKDDRTRAGIIIEYKNIPGSEVCTNFVMRSAELIAGTRLSFMSVNESDNLIDNGEVSLNKVAVACDREKNNIFWFFRLTY